MQDFCDSLSPTQEDSVDKDLVSPRASDAMSVMDMDSGDLHPLDHCAWDKPSLSSCDMSLDDGSQVLDNLLEELSDLPSSLDDSLCDLPSSSDDSLYGLLSDMSVDEWTQREQDPCFDLDDFVS